MKPKFRLEEKKKELAPLHVPNAGKKRRGRQKRYASALRGQAPRRLQHEKESSQIRQRETTTRKDERGLSDLGC